MSQRSYHNQSRWGCSISLFCSAMVAATLALSLAIPTGYSYGSAILCLGAIGLLALKRPRPRLRSEDVWFVGAYLLYFALNVVTNLAHELSARAYEEPSRFLLAAPIIPILLRYPPHVMFWWAGLVVGSLAAGALALWEVFVVGQSRADGFMNPIQFGNLALLSGALCLAGWEWGRQQSHSRFWTLALSLGAIVGVLASLLSGTRGGWLALPVILGVFYLAYRHRLKRRVVGVSVLVLLVAGVSVYTIPKTGVQERVARAIEQVQSYQQGQTAATSVGVRLEMWRIGLQMSAEHPLMGWGERAYIQPMADRINDVEVRQMVLQFDHVHSDMLDTLIKRGIVGLVALLVVYFVPLWLFWCLWRSKSAPVAGRAFALSGVITVLCVVVFGITQAFMRHNSGVTIYAFYVAVLWGYGRCCLAGSAPDRQRTWPPSQ